MFEGGTEGRRRNTLQRCGREGYKVFEGGLQVLEGGLQGSLGVDCMCWRGDCRAA